MTDQDNSLTVTMFGELQIRVNNLPIPRVSAKAQELFAMLILWNELPVSRKRLASTLWPESKQPNALGLLRTTLMELRKALGPASVRLPTADHTTLHLDLRGASIDILEFDRAVLQPDPTGIQTATALYRQDLLLGWRAAWVQPERERRSSALSRLAGLPAAMTLAESHSPDVSMTTHPATIGRTLRGKAPLSVATLLAVARAALKTTSDQLDQLETLQSSSGLTESAQDTASRAESLYSLGVSKHLAGDIEGSRVCQQEALLLAQRLEDLSGPSIQAKALDQLGRLSMNLDKVDAHDFFKRAYEIRMVQYGEVLQSLVTSHLGLGDVATTLTEALDWYEKALRMSETNQDQRGVAWCRFSLANAALFRNNWNISMLGSTVANFQKALSGFVEIQDPTGLFAVLDGLARVCHKVGHTDATTSMLQIEATLRDQYSTTQERNKQEEATSSFAAARRAISAADAGNLRHGDSDWSSAIAEAERVIHDLAAMTQANEA